MKLQLVAFLVIYVILSLILFLSKENSKTNEDLNKLFSSVIQKTLQKNSESPVTIETATPQKKYKKIAPFGRQCNRLVVLATGLERAKKEGFTLLIDKHDWPLFEKIDMELFETTFKGLYEFTNFQSRVKDENWFTPATEYWCGLQTNLESLRFGFRPKLAFRKQAEELINKIYMENPDDLDIMSIHIRKYDGLCEKQLPTSCEWTGGYEFLPTPFGCNQTLTKPFLDWILTEWPDYPWFKRKLVIYLSTDRQDPSVDLSYIQRYRDFGIYKVYEPTLPRKSKEKNFCG